MKKGFTLAEIMIVLIVIAVLTAILLPAARNAMPNEKVMKFKKGHNALYSAISELVNSDKYYLDGDLGTKYNGEVLYQWETKPEQQKYFCNSLADVLSVKFLECTTSDNSALLYILECSGTNPASRYGCNGKEVSSEYLQNRKEALDSGCKSVPFKNNIPAKQFVMQDNIWYYELGAAGQFGNTYFGKTLGLTGSDANKRFRVFSPPSQAIPTFHDSNGLDVMYKPFCMDIDGVPDNATATDCINECPFGYGIRADGKILNGARADEWLEKSIQDKD